MDRNKKIWLALGGVVLIILFIVVLQVVMRKPYTTIKLANIPEGEYDPAVWGRYYTLEYKSYMRNHEAAPSPTGFGGSEKVQKSVKEPEILINFKGMPFSVDYTEDRGHVFALEDLKETKRINQTTPGSCMTCKTAYLADIFKEKGWDYAKTPLFELLPRLKHPIVCANCHDPKTMNLRVINPAFVEAMQERGIDVKKANREEMRSYVCGQCHVEYYFVPANKKVVLPHKAKRAWIWEQRLMRIADEGGGNGSATAIIFALKNVAPEEFADRVVNQHTGPNDGPVQIAAAPMSAISK